MVFRDTVLVPLTVVSVVSTIKSPVVGPLSSPTVPSSSHHPRWMSQKSCLVLCPNYWALLGCLFENKIKKKVGLVSVVYRLDQSITDRLPKSAGFRLTPIPDQSTHISSSFHIHLRILQCISSPCSQIQSCWLFWTDGLRTVVFRRYVPCRVCWSSHPIHWSKLVNRLSSASSTVSMTVLVVLSVLYLSCGVDDLLVLSTSSLICLELSECIYSLDNQHSCLLLRD